MTRSAVLEEKQELFESATAVPEMIEGLGEDGFPYREWKVNGKPERFSLKPYDDRPLYWYPMGVNKNMKWRSQERNAYGIQPVVQWERWIDGQFRPRNAWEEHMTRQWLSERKGAPPLPKDGSPYPWQGTNHPAGPHGHYLCECGWACGNWRVLNDHCRYLSHRLAVRQPSF